jgi:hypothetical protein
VKKYKYLGHSQAHAIKTLAFFEALFQMIDELINSHSINSQYFQFSKQQALNFLDKQEKFKSTIEAEGDYCLNLITAEINSVFNISTTELNTLQGVITKFPKLKQVLENEVEAKKARHQKLTGVLNKSEQGLTAEVKKAFDLLQQKFDNQTERIKITFAIN